jgi:hypothetical protein
MSQIGQSAIVCNVQNGVIRAGESGGGVLESRRIYDLRGADAQMGSAHARDVVGTASRDPVKRLETLRKELRFFDSLTCGIQPIRDSRAHCLQGSGVTPQKKKFEQKNIQPGS